MTNEQIIAIFAVVLGVLSLIPSAYSHALLAIAVVLLAIAVWL